MDIYSKNEQDFISKILLNLSSMNSELSEKAFLDLKEILNLINANQYVELSMALHCLYSLKNYANQRQAGINQIIDICLNLDLPKYLEFIQVFLSIFTEVCEKGNYTKQKNYEVLLKQITLNVYLRLKTSDNWKQNFKKWNDYLCNKMIFDSNSKLISRFMGFAMASSFTRSF